MIRISNKMMLKTFLISTALFFSVAVILKPLIMDFTPSDIPLIWTFILSCLKPPYLYLLINCIIITILASSNLHSPPPQPTIVSVRPEPLKVFPIFPPEEFSYAEFLSVAKVADHPVMREAEAEYNYGTKGSKYDDLAGNVDAGISEADVVTTTVNGNVSGETKGKDEIVMSRSWLTPVGAQHSVSTQILPPCSTRFARRKSVKATPEVGRTLGVSKPKRHDTLETTWKTITEGRPMPLNRHLRKSDTWETNHRPQIQHNQKMGKSETFNDRSNKPVVRKEASLSRDDLNRRVEAFINKVNEDMRLQRQESLNQYMEMVNRSHGY